MLACIGLKRPSISKNKKQLWSFYVDPLMPYYAEDQLTLDSYYPQLPINIANCSLKISAGQIYLPNPINKSRTLTRKSNTFKNFTHLIPKSNVYPFETFFETDSLIKYQTLHSANAYHLYIYTITVSWTLFSSRSSMATAVMIKNNKTNLYMVSKIIIKVVVIFTNKY